MWKSLISINPNLIVMYKGSDEKIFKLALDKGYKIKEKDLQKSQALRQSEEIMTAAIEIDPNLIKYYEKEKKRIGIKKHNKELIDKAIEKGYEPTIEDLENNKDLGLSILLINILIENNHPEAIKYAKGKREEFTGGNFLSKSNEYNDKEALEKWEPQLEDVENNPSLGASYEIMRKLLENPKNASVIKYIKTYANESEKLIQIALINYTPTIEDVENNWYLSVNSDVIKLLIDKDPNNIIYYNGEKQEIFNYALEKNYKPQIEHLKKNYNLTRSDNIMLILVSQDSSLIEKYLGENEEVFKTAYEHGYNEEKAIKILETKNGFNISKSVFLAKKLLDQDINNFKYYINTTNKEIIKYVLDKNYKLDEQFFNELNRRNWSSEYTELFDLIIDYDVNYIKYYNSHTISPIIKAITLGYLPTEEEVEKYKEYYSQNEYEKIITALIKNNHPEYIKYYEGIDEEIYKSAISLGYIPSKETIEKNTKINQNYEIMTAIVELEPDYCELYKGYDERERNALRFIAGKYTPSYEEVRTDYHFYKKYKVMKKLIEIDYNYVKYMWLDNLDEEKELYELAWEKGFRPSIEELRNIGRIPTNYSIMKKLIEIDYHYIKCIKIDDQEEKKQLYELAEKKGYRPSIEEAEKEPIIFSIDALVKHLLEIDKNIINKYKGTNVEIFNLAIDKKCYIPKYFSKNITNTNEVILYLIDSKDFSVLENFQGDYSEFKRLFKIALDIGYEPKIDDIDDRTFDIIDKKVIKKLINEADKKKSIEILLKIYYNENAEEIVDYIIKNKNININNGYLILLKDYYYDKEKFIENIDKYKEFLNTIGIEETIFVRYGFSISYDWLSDMLTIIDTGKLQEFTEVKEWFFANYYKESKSPITLTKNIINILKNYIRYNTLCLDIIKNPNLTREQKENVEFLFGSNNLLNEETIPKNIEELSNIEQKFVDKYKEELKGIEEKDIIEVKDILCKLLFNSNLYDIEQKLIIYGDIKDLSQLLFNNRNNPDICDDITELMIYVSMMEAVVESNDKEYLIEVAYRTLENIKSSFKCMMLFDSFEEKMKKMYEKDLIANMTVLKQGKTPKSLLDEEMTEKYGVDVIELSDKKYCMLYHVMSPRETPQELAEGLTSPEKNTICLSSGSNRNQTLIGDGIIFLTDTLPKGVFIRSSINNMGSNGSVRGNSYEDRGSKSERMQRGILETSYAGRGNSEILCFREGIKFKYLALPGGREPTEEEIKIAKQNGLKFIKTQKLETTIYAPQEINPEYLEKKEDSEEKKQLKTIKELKDKLLKNKSGPRKIAIFSDAHGLFEPTLAILTDARRKGITEIYSLGDNIGTGPNPKEVVELLDEYGVISLKGNHEIYSTEGIDVLREHLIKTGAYEEAKRNSSYTRSKLTKEQIEKIKKDPESRVIEIGGKKILLSHFMKDYNTGENKEIPQNISDVFQGHLHIIPEEEENDKTTTVRGAGIGDRQYKGEAYYIILTEKPDGGYEIEKRVVPFDIRSTYHDINESELNNDDKTKIQGWAGVRR